MGGESPVSRAPPLAVETRDLKIGSMERERAHMLGGPLEHGASSTRASLAARCRASSAHTHPTPAFGDLFWVVFGCLFCQTSSSHASLASTPDERHLRHSHGLQ